MVRLTPFHFYQYLKCPSWVWLDVYGGHEQRARLHPLVETLWREGLLEEKSLLQNKDLVTVLADDLEIAATETIEFMKKGVKTVYHGALLRGQWVARPDLLERVEGKSIFGDYYYVACDLKNIKEMDDVHKFQAAFYGLLLNELQGVMPKKGYVLNQNGKILDFNIEDIIEKFNLALSEIEKILQGEKPAPFLSAGCQETPWHAVCVKNAEECDDISLAAHLTFDEYKAIKAAGIVTVSDFANKNSDELTSLLPSLSRERLEKIKLQSEVLLEKKPRRLGKMEFSKSNTELFIEIQTDPLRGAEYLFGVLLRQDGKSSYHPFFSNSPKNESETWLSFVEFIGRFSSASIYHFGNYDTLVMRRLAQKYGHVLGMTDKLRDLAAETGRIAVFPVYFYSLRDIAETLGYVWEKPVVSRNDAIILYHRWIETENKKFREKIINANESDLCAQMLLKDWLAK